MGMTQGRRGHYSYWASHNNIIIRLEFFAKQENNLKAKYAVLGEILHLHYRRLRASKKRRAICPPLF
jgi:hypothetical protein